METVQKKPVCLVDVWYHYWSFVYIRVLVTYQANTRGMANSAYQTCLFGVQGDVTFKVIVTKKKTHSSLLKPALQIKFTDYWKVV